MRIAAVQMDIAFENRKVNYEKAERFADEAESRGADLLILPEMFSTGFSMNPSLTAEPLDGETPGFMRSCARRHRMGVLGGFVLECEGSKPMNVALAVGPNGDDLSLYAKAHLFSFMGEDRLHSAGDGPRVFEMHGLRASCFICYDLRFPELFRLIADTCHVVFVIASWPESRQSHFDILLRARAVENQLYVVGVNRVGEGDGLAFRGGSAVVDPEGVVVGGLESGEGLLVVDIERSKVEAVRGAFPFLKDRRFQA